MAKEDLNVILEAEIDYYITCPPEYRKQALKAIEKTLSMIRGNWWRYR